MSLVPESTERIINLESRCAERFRNPVPMPLDASEWCKRLSVVQFVNAYYQIRDCLAYGPCSVLIVGVGHGLEKSLLAEKYGIAVTTLDIDPGFDPDFVGSVHDMDMFAEQQFDVVIASHVLEHLPFSLFDQALGELTRVARHAIVYLPFGGRHNEIKLVTVQRVKELCLRFSLPPIRNWRITGEEPVLQGGHHFWEIGYRGFGLKRVQGVMEKHFVVDRTYRNPEWLYSQNFLLTSRRVPDWTPDPRFFCYSSFEFHHG